MITIEEGLRAFLVANVTVNGLVSGRVYPNKLPQTVTMPALTYQRIDTPRVHSHDSSGSAGTAYPRIQFDCWAASYASAKSLSDALRGALNGYVGTMGTVNPVMVQSALQEDERFDDFADAGVVRISCDFTVWHLET